MAFDAQKFMEALQGGALKTAVRLAVEKAGGAGFQLFWERGKVYVEVLTEAGDRQVYSETLVKPVQKVRAPIHNIRGVGVMRHPDGELTGGGATVSCQEWAERVLTSMQSGSVLYLSNAKDEDGDYLWDFKIEGGPPGQVEVRRAEEGDS